MSDDDSSDSDIPFWDEEQIEKKAEEKRDEELENEAEKVFLEAERKAAEDESLLEDLATEEKDFCFDRVNPLLADVKKAWYSGQREAIELLSGTDFEQADYDFMNFATQHLERKDPLKPFDAKKNPMKPALDMYRPNGELVGFKDDAHDGENEEEDDYYNNSDLDPSFMSADQSLMEDLLQDETCYSKVKIDNDTQVNLNSMLRGIRTQLSNIGTCNKATSRMGRVAGEQKNKSVTNSVGTVDEESGAMLQADLDVFLVLFCQEEIDGVTAAIASANSFTCAVTGSNKAVKTQKLALTSLSNATTMVSCSILNIEADCTSRLFAGDSVKDFDRMLSFRIGSERFSFDFPGACVFPIDLDLDEDEKNHETPSYQICLGDLQKSVDNAYALLRSMHQKLPLSVVKKNVRTYRYKNKIGLLSDNFILCAKGTEDLSIMQLGVKVVKKFSCRFCKENEKPFELDALKSYQHMAYHFWDDEATFASSGKYWCALCGNSCVQFHASLSDTQNCAVKVEGKGKIKIHCNTFGHDIDTFTSRYMSGENNNSCATNRPLSCPACKTKTKDLFFYSYQMKNHYKNDHVGFVMGDELVQLCEESDTVIEELKEKHDGSVYRQKRKK